LQHAPYSNHWPVSTHMPPTTHGHGTRLQVMPWPACHLYGLLAHLPPASRNPGSTTPKQSSRLLNLNIQIAIVLLQKLLSTYFTFLCKCCKTSETMLKIHCNSESITFAYNPMSPITSKLVSICFSVQCIFGWSP